MTANKDEQTSEDKQAADIIAADQKTQEAIANGELQVFLYPGDNPISVVAVDRKEADKKYKALKEEQDHA
jgi:hypothetical protein